MNKFRKNDTPYFSVLIPSYNRPDYIAKCIDSIIHNDFNDYEILISDDNSPMVKEVENAVKPYLIYPNIHFYKQKKNLKEPMNKNFLVERAKGEYNIIIGDDDRFYPYTLKRIKKSIDENPDYDLYCFGYTVIDESDNFFYSRHAPFEIEISLLQRDLVKHLLISDIFPFWLFHPATFCCKRGVEKKIRYSDGAGIGEDFLFLFDYINNRNRILIIPEDLFFWRKVQNLGVVRQGNQSSGKLNDLKARRMILYHLLSRNDLDPVIYNIITKFYYRKRFLYNCILANKTEDRDIIPKLDLDFAHKREFEIYKKSINSFDIKVKPYLNRALTFTRMFGLKGFIEVIIVCLQRSWYFLRC